MLWPRLITKSTHGDRQAYYVTELIRSRMSRPASSSTRSSVSEAWEMKRSKLGRTKLNEIGRIVFWKIWIVSTTSRRSSSGKYCQESHCWTSSKRFQVWCEICNVHFKDRIIFMSMYNDMESKRKQKKDMNKIHRQWRIMLADSFEYIDLSWIWTRREVTRNLHQQIWRIMESNQHRIWRQFFSESGHPIFRVSSVFERGELRSKKGGKKSIYTSTVAMKTSSYFSVRWVLQISAVSTT